MGGNMRSLVVATFVAIAYAVHVDEGGCDHQKIADAVSVLCDVHGSDACAALKASGMHRCGSSARLLADDLREKAEGTVSLGEGIRAFEDQLQHETDMGESSDSMDCSTARTKVEELCKEEAAHMASQGSTPAHAADTVPPTTSAAGSGVQPSSNAATSHSTATPYTPPAHASSTGGDTADSC